MKASIMSTSRPSWPTTSPPLVWLVHLTTHPENQYHEHQQSLYAHYICLPGLNDQHHERIGRPRVNITMTTRPEGQHHEHRPPVVYLFRLIIRPGGQHQPPLLCAQRFTPSLRASIIRISRSSLPFASDYAPWRASAVPRMSIMSISRPSYAWHLCLTTSGA